MSTAPRDSDDIEVVVGDLIRTPAHDHANGDLIMTRGRVEKILDTETGLIEFSHSSGLVYEEIHSRHTTITGFNTETPRSWDPDN